MSKRRELLKGLAVGSVWAAPVVSSIVLPVHAQTSCLLLILSCHINDTYNGEYVSSDQWGDRPHYTNGKGAHLYFYDSDLWGGGSGWSLDTRDQSSESNPGSLDQYNGGYFSISTSEAGYCPPTGELSMDAGEVDNPGTICLVPSGESCSCS